jgi:hypothetical protein
MLLRRCKITLEAVAGLINQGFVAGLRRFIARHAEWSRVYCYSGTNFNDNSNEVKDFYTPEQSAYVEKLQNLHSSENLYLIIPLHTSHFGALWEAAVNSIQCCRRYTVRSNIVTCGELTSYVRNRRLSKLKSPCAQSTDPYPSACHASASFLVNHLFTYLHLI